jgi:hypothetical protein
MKNTFLSTQMARSMLVAGVILGITGAAHAQIGPGGSVLGGAARGGSAGIGIGGGVAGEAGVGGAGIAGEAGPTSGGVAGEAGPASGAAAGRAGGEMSGMAKTLPGLEQGSRMREQAIPGLGNSVEPRAGAAFTPDIPPGRERTSKAASRMKGPAAIERESTGMEVGPQEQGVSANPSVPRY